VQADPKAPAAVDAKTMANRSRAYLQELGRHRIGNKYATEKLRGLVRFAPTFNDLKGLLLKGVEVGRRKQADQSMFPDTNGMWSVPAAVRHAPFPWLVGWLGGYYRCFSCFCCSHLECAPQAEGFCLSIESGAVT
jgi:hypothetical protein